MSYMDFSCAHYWTYFFPSVLRRSFFNQKIYKKDIASCDFFGSVYNICNLNLNVYYA